MRRLAILAVLFLVPGCVSNGHSHRPHYYDNRPPRGYYAPPPPAFRGPPPRAWGDDGHRRGWERRSHRH